MRARLTLVIAVVLLPLPLAAEEGEPPSLELLEYLGGWEDEHGQWLDPRILELASADGRTSEKETDDEDDDN